MIFRKPYAFFIKHFKLFHLILVILTTYLAYRTKILLDFFNEYIGNIVNVTGQDLIGTLMYGIVSALPIIIILLTGVILGVMMVKKKAYTFYIINIIVYIFAIVALSFSKNTLSGLEESLLDVRTIRLVRDLLSITFITQLFTCVIIGIRAVGFDIRKFDFKKDLQDLQIEEEDSEEVEVELNVDKNKLRRNIRRLIRFSKYTYKENKLLINLASVGIVIVVSALSVIGINNMNKKINQNVFFNGNNFTLKIVDSYLTNTDYKGNIISEENSFVIIRVYIRNNMEKSSFDIATAKLIIGPYVYTPRVDKRDKLFDFGNIYNDEKINIDYEYKTFIYEIPKQLSKEEMVFSFVDKDTLTKGDYLKNTKVKINYHDLTKNEETFKYLLNEKVDFEESILDGYALNINSAEVQKTFKLQYNFCVSKECYLSYEYLKPSVTTTYNKALLKIKGNLQINPDIELIGIFNLYDFINQFGVLKYTINGEEKTQNLAFQEVRSNKIKNEETFYIEVLEEVINAEKISLEFKIRNRNYEYVLK